MISTWLLAMTIAKAQPKIVPKTLKTRPKIICVKRRKVVYPTIVTFYENLHRSNAYGASGINLSRGGNTCAAPMDIPFHTNLHVKGLGIYKVADRGAAIHWLWEKGKRYLRLDIYVEDYKLLPKHWYRLGRIYTVTTVLE